MLKQKVELRNIELRIGYQGTRYFGWQIQPEHATVQGILQRALIRVLDDKHVRTVGSSRTDTGVHAHDNHVGFRTSSRIPLVGLVRTLNHMLPADIRVLEAFDRPAGFTVRHDARAKHYTYFIYNGQDPSPFLGPFMLRYHKQLDDQAMEEAARIFEGRHCFKALQGSADVRDGTETTIFTTKVARHGKVICFDVIGRHFLYHMVRNMVGALLLIGRGEWRTEDMRARLIRGDRTLMAATAPPQGLHLFKVYFDEGPYTFCPERETFLRCLLP